jgi:hypothetical protein
MFEHSFTLIGLVLGLALADLLSGLVRAVRTRGFKALGLLTPMLAIFFVLDVTTFWGIIWSFRTMMPSSIWPALGFGIVLTSMYYTAASLVLPNSISDTFDFDAYYMDHRRIVLSLMLACYLIVTALGSSATGRLDIDTVGIAWITLVVLTLMAPWKSANRVGLGLLIFVDILAFVPQLVGL